jgi:alkylated DNA nucleotide flippase Atl1
VTGKFEIARRDGRSNVQVLLDLVKAAEPGRVFTYDEIAEALGTETERSYSREAVQAIVASAYSRLLKEQQRALYNVRELGYRVAHANEHSRLAMTRKHRADVQMLRGLQTLENVRTEEMDPQSRQSHEGMLMVVGAMYQNQRAMDRRLRAVEEAIGLRKKT